jgi:hypothetical protein
MSAQRLRVLEGELAVVRLAADAPVPAWAWHGALCSVTRSAEELSIVCESAAVPAALERVERGWRALMLRGPFAFSQTGVLASIATPLAAAGVSLFAISTFDTDYLLVKHDQLEHARAALVRAGHTFEAL